MANPTLISKPEKTINGFLSKWNAVAQPVIFTISNDKYPTGASVTNYYTKVDIYVDAQLVGTINQVPDSNNETKIDVRKYVQTALSYSLSSVGNDLNAATTVYIEGTEEYVDSGGTPQSNPIDNAGASEVVNVTLSSLPFGNPYGGNMYDYVIDSSKIDLGRWLTPFNRGTIIDFINTTVSIIANETPFDLRIKQYNVNQVEIEDDLENITDQGVGLYRVTLSNIQFNIETVYIVIFAEIGGVQVSEPYIVDVDIQCLDSPEAPTDLIITNVLSNEIDLEWTSNSNFSESGFSIERGLDGLSFVQIDTVSTGVTTYNDNTVNSFTDYFYRVKALGAIPSAYSNIANATTTAFLEDSAIVYSPFSREILNFGLQNQLCSIRRVTDNETGSLEPLEDGDIIDITNIINTSDVGQTNLNTWIGANDADVVTLFDQKQGVANLVQNNTPNQPNMVNSGAFPVVSGNPSLRFDGNDQSLASLGNVDEIRFDRDFMIFIVVNNQLSNSLGAIMATNSDNNGDLNFRVFIDRRAGNNLCVQYKNSLAVLYSVDAPATISDANNHVYTITNNGTTREMSVFVDGVAGDQNVVIGEPSINDTALRLCIDKPSSFALDGGVNLWCCYDVLDNTKRSEVETYLLNKFA